MNHAKGSALMTMVGLEWGFRKSNDAWLTSKVLGERGQERFLWIH